MYTPKTTQMKKILKKSASHTFLAREIEGGAFEYVSTQSRETDDFDTNGDLIKSESQTPYGLSITEYENSKRVRNRYEGEAVDENGDYIDSIYQYFQFEYDEDGNLKPYRSLGNYQEAMAVEYDDQGRRIERYTTDYDDRMFVYENGLLVEERYELADGTTYCSQYEYDSKGRKIKEETSDDEVTMFEYDDSDHLIRAKSMCIRVEEDLSVEYSLKEYIREDARLSKRILYKCEPLNDETIITDNGIELVFPEEGEYEKSIIEVVEYILEETEAETTPYIDDIAGPFVIKTESEYANDCLQSRLIKIYSKSSEELLKSISVSGYCDTICGENIQVTESVYEYYS